MVKCLPGLYTYLKPEALCREKNKKKNNQNQAGVLNTFENLSALHGAFLVWKASLKKQLN